METATSNNTAAQTAQRITSNDIEQAFKFFSNLPDGSRVSKADIHKKLEGLFEGLISMDEHKILFGAKAFYEPPLVKPKKGSHQVEQRVQSASSVSVADIERVMGINKEEGETATPKAYDVSQVFKLFDIDSEGHISDQMLRSIVTNYNINTYGGSAVNNNIVKSTTTPHVPPSQQTPLMQRRQSVVAAPSSAKHQSAGKQRTTKPQGLRYDKDVMLKFFDRDGDGGIGLNDFISLTNNAAKQSQQ